MPKFRLWVEVDLPGAQDVLDVHEPESPGSKLSLFQGVLLRPEWWTACGASRVDTSPATEEPTNGR